MQIHSANMVWFTGVWFSHCVYNGTSNNVSHLHIPNSRHLPNNRQDSVHQPYFPLLQYKTNLSQADTSLLRTMDSYACTNKQRPIQFYLY